MAASSLTVSRALTRRAAPQLYTALTTRPSCFNSPFRFQPLKLHLSSHLSPAKHFHNTPTMASSLNFLDACENRRTIYQITDKIPISDARVEEIAKHNILHVPHSFNATSTRLVVLLNDEHKQFWEFVKEVLKPQVPEDQFSKTVEKLDGFKAGHGTVCNMGSCFEGDNC